MRKPGVDVRTVVIAEPPAKQLATFVVCRFREVAVPGLLLRTNYETQVKRRYRAIRNRSVPRSWRAFSTTPQSSRSNAADTSLTPAPPICSCGDARIPVVNIIET